MRLLFHGMLQLPRLVRLIHLQQSAVRTLHLVFGISTTLTFTTPHRFLVTSFPRQPDIPQILPPDALPLTLLRLMSGECHSPVLRVRDLELYSVETTAPHAFSRRSDDRLIYAEACMLQLSSQPWVTSAKRNSARSFQGWYARARAL